MLSRSAYPDIKVCLPQCVVYPIRTQELELQNINQTVRPSLARFSEKDGGGLYATIEIGHQLHCLVRNLLSVYTVGGSLTRRSKDSLRRNSHIDYYGPLDDNFKKRPEFYRVHIGRPKLTAKRSASGLHLLTHSRRTDHCIELIRQALMCNADVGLITYDWVEGFELPFPNLNTRHTCRDFERIYEWYDRHKVPLTQPAKRTDGVVNLSPEDIGAGRLVN